MKDITPGSKRSADADENTVFDNISKIIETRKHKAAAHANQEVTMMFWEIGRYINSVILENKRAEYGKQIVSKLSSQLVIRYGKSFNAHNLRRMMRFAEFFNDLKIVSEITTQLSWTHIVELLRLKTDEARSYYAKDAIDRNYGTIELRRQISRKAFERREIANLGLSEGSSVPFNVFKDPCILDMFGLKDNFLEADLEKAIIKELESFILEFGHGLALVERQKRMIIDGEDVILDLLFFSRSMKRLVAVELKIGRFKAAHMGQMLLYLKWLNRYERQEWEEAPIGMILCATADREKIELLEMDKSGIAVAEYWTHLPPKAEFEKKIRTIIAEAKERLERRKLLPDSKNVRKEIDYFIEVKDAEDE